MATNNSCDYQPTQYNIQTGGSSGKLNNVAPSSTSGVPVISQGSSSQPIFGTAVVAGGGTGVTSFANTSSLLSSGTSTTGNLQNIASVASGQVLTSAGTSTLPAWSATPTLSGINLGNTTLTTFIEGTWTPNIQINGSNTGITYTTQNGWYTQINNLVMFGFVILLSSKGSNSGNVTISNMPVSYGTDGSQQSVAVAQAGHTAGTNLTGLSLTGSVNSTVGNFYVSNINGNTLAVQMTDANLENTSGIKGFGGYFIY